MRSESSVRYWIAKLSVRTTRGVREEAARVAVIEALRWVVRKHYFDPESPVIDASIDDHRAPIWVPAPTGSENTP